MTRRVFIMEVVWLVVIDRYCLEHFLGWKLPIAKLDGFYANESQSKISNDRGVRNNKSVWNTFDSIDVFSLSEGFQPAGQNIGGKNAGRQQKGQKMWAESQSNCLLVVLSHACGRSFNSSINQLPKNFCAGCTEKERKNQWNAFEFVCTFLFS